MEDELYIWYKVFCEKCLNGKMFEKKFVEIYKNYYFIGDVIIFVGYVFCIFDKNKDGIIDFYEFI